MKAPLTLNELLVAKHFARDPVTHAIVPDAVLRDLHDAMSAGRSHAEQIAAAHTAIMADTTKTEAARLIAAKQTVAKLAQAAAGRLDKAHKSASDELARIVEETAAPPSPITAAELQLQSEIRDRLARMDDKKRGELISAAIQSGDDSVIGAVLTGPAWLTGIGEAQREMQRQIWRKRKFADTVEREARLKKAIEAVERGGTALVGFVQELTEGPKAKVVEASAKAASDAVAAANAA